MPVFSKHKSPYINIFYEFISSTIVDYRFTTSQSKFYKKCISHSSNKSIPCTDQFNFWFVHSRFQV